MDTDTGSENGGETQIRVEQTRVGEKEYKILRQLTSQQIESALRTPGNELDVQPRTTEEGFRILGSNTNEDIAELESLDGIPISQIERLMQARSSQGASASTGMLGQNEGLKERLIQDNDLVHSLRKPDGSQLEHRDLFYALREVRAAIVTMAPAGQDVTFIYEHGHHKLIIVRRVDTGGMQYSPFEPEVEERKETANDDITIINLQNGANVYLPGIAPYFVSRGFYEGEIVPRRFDPVAIAESTGRVAIPVTDPVVELTRNSDAHVELTNLSQIRRLVVSSEIGYRFLASTNWKIKCNSPTEYLEAIKLLESRLITDEQFKTQVDVSNLQPATIHVGVHGFGRYTENTVSQDFIAQTQYANRTNQDIVTRVSENIQEIELAGDKEVFAREIVSSAIAEYHHVTQQLEPIFRRSLRTRVGDTVKRIRGRHDQTTDTQILDRAHRVRDFYIELLSKVSDKQAMKRALEKCIENDVLVTNSIGKQRAEIDQFLTMLSAKFD